MKRLRQEDKNTAENWGRHWATLPPWRFGIDVLTARLELFAANIREGDSVLDVGGARGEIAEWIKQRVKCNILVADISPSAIASCTARGIPAIECDCAHLENHFGNASFDVVMSGETLEHMEDPADFVRQLVKACKPNGLVQLSTPFEEQWNQDEHHLWSFTIEDVLGFLRPYGNAVATKVDGGMIVASCRLGQTSEKDTPRS